jgi:hypothetical protein
MTTARNQHQQIEAQQPEAGTASAPARKPFVEPRISDAVDVLEATTFFQAVDSGGTGLRRRRGND